MVTRPSVFTLGAAAAIAVAALAALGCNSCSSPPKAQEPPVAAVPSVEPTASAPPADTAQERASGGCSIGGCSGELCEAPNMPQMATTCMHKPEWDCYKTAQCGRNAQNQCEWTLTPELEKCLEIQGKRGGGDIH